MHLPPGLAALALALLAACAATSPQAATRIAAMAAAAAPKPAQQAACSWNAPGHNPFMGDLVAAVDAYQDIPAAARLRLQQRMASRAYDEVVRIRRDSIDGQRAYRSEIRDMHFGNGQRCATVDRSAWPAQAEERGLVYCEAGHCVLVPTVCRNLSRIQIADAGGGVAAAPGQPVVSAAQQAAAAPADAALPTVAAAAAPPDGTALALSLPTTDAAALPGSQLASFADGTPSANSVNGTDRPGDWLTDLLTGAPGAQNVQRLDVPPRFQPDLLVPSLTGPLLAVPEPATPLLMLTGWLLLAACRRRFRSALSRA